MGLRVLLARRKGWFECHIGCDVSHSHGPLRHNPTFSPGVSHCCNDEDESFLGLVPKTLGLGLVLSSNPLIFNKISPPTPIGFLTLSHSHSCLPWILSEPPRAISCDRNSFLSGSSRELGQELLPHPISPVCSQEEHTGWALTTDIRWLANQMAERRGRKAAQGVAGIGTL